MKSSILETSLQSITVEHTASGKRFIILGLLLV